MWLTIRSAKLGRWARVEVVVGRPSAGQMEGRRRTKERKKDGRRTRGQKVNQRWAKFGERTRGLNVGGAEVFDLFRSPVVSGRPPGCLPFCLVFPVKERGIDVFVGVSTFSVVQLYLGTREGTPHTRVSCNTLYSEREGAAVQLAGKGKLQSMEYREERADRTSCRSCRFLLSSPGQQQRQRAATTERTCLATQ